MRVYSIPAMLPVPVEADPPRDYGRRNLPVWAFIVIAAAWVAIVKLVGAACSGRADVHDGRLLTIHDLTWSLVIPIGAGCVFVYAVIAVLGWWRPLLYDPKPTRRWVWWIPVIFVAAIVGGVNYSGLSDRGAAFTIVLLFVAMLIGFGEEGLFRCVGVTTLRRNGLTEGKVALWSSVIFGLAHVANLIGGDAKAFGQAIIVAFAGYFFYLIRRVSRSNILNSVLHGMFDFTIITAAQIVPEGEKGHAIGAALAILVYIACGVLVLTRHHSIEPVPPSTAAAEDATAAQG